MSCYWERCLSTCRCTHVENVIFNTCASAPVHTFLPVNIYIVKDKYVHECCVQTYIIPFMYMTIHFSPFFLFFSFLI